MAWTSEMVEALKQMHKNGASFTKISRDLDVSRNAAIGKAHRLNLAKRKPSPPEHPRPKAQPKQKRINVTASHPPYEPPPSPPSSEHPHAVTILGLEARSCRWPLGEPAHDMLYCGEMTFKEGQSYCLDHARRAASKEVRRRMFRM